MTDSDLTGLANLPNLTRLDLSFTRISDHGLQQLKAAPRIAELNLYYDELITDAGIAALKGWKHLKRLNVRGTKVTDAALQQLSAIPSLESLDIGYALITDVGLDPLASLPNLPRTRHRRQQTHRQWPAAAPANDRADLSGSGRARSAPIPACGPSA